jgi:stage IV sporulation protein FB
MLNQSYLLGRVLGIPIRVHLTLLILAPVLALMVTRGLGLLALLVGLVLVVMFFASVALHELGHSVVAIRYGCQVQQIMLLPIGGVAQLSHMPANPRQEMHIALAGPAVSLLLFLTLGLAARLVAGMGMREPAIVLAMVSHLNLVLVLFNLLPSFPMDGGRVFRAFMTPRVGRLAATRMASRVGRFMAWVFGLYGLLIFNPFLILIAVFIHQAAGAEYRMVYLEEARKQGTGFPFEARPAAGGPAAFGLSDDEVIVGPPPYEQGAADSPTARARRVQQDLFDRLFEDWRA